MADLKKSILGAIAKKIRAYHGSPFEFDKFDLQKMGTGEGFQSYGDGLYFAEEPKVAEHYKNALTPPPKLTYTGPEHPGSRRVIEDLGEFLDVDSLSRNPTRFKQRLPRALEDVRDAMFDQIYQSKKLLDDPPPWFNSAMKNDHLKMIGQIQESIAALGRSKPDHFQFMPSGDSKLYTVDIHGDPITDFIDLDKNLVHQPEIMRKAESVANRYSDHSSGMDDVLRLLDRATAKPPRVLIPGRDPRSPLSYTNKPVNTGEGPRGRELYDALHKGLGPLSDTDDLLAWAEAMKERGLFGNRYKDEHSRFQAKLGENEESTHNYVVWDPDRIDIVDKKYLGGPV